MAHEIPCSSTTALDLTESAIFFDEPKTEAAAASSVAADIEKDASASDEIFRGSFACFSTANKAVAAAPSADLEGAGRKRRKTPLAPGPAAGIRSSTSRWWMRSALTCV
jgi:hypothetical protein